MIILGVLFFACMTAFFVDVAAPTSQGIVFPGWISAIGFAGMCVVGTALAIGALS